MLKDSRSIRLEFGNEKQIDFVKKIERTKEIEDEFGKQVEWNTREVVMAECPYCGNESYYCEDDNDAFDEITVTLDNGDVVCSECNKKIRIS